MRTDSATPALGGSRLRDHACVPPGVNVLKLWIHVLGLGILGVLGFSLTLPMTRLAVSELNPIFVSLGRSLISAALAAGVLLWKRDSFPGARYLPSLLVVALGVVVGFPVFTTLAMREVPASHGAVVTGILPLGTALFGALRARERPSAGFWLAASAGTATIVAYAVIQSGLRPTEADMLLVAAVATCSAGYAEGGRLSREHPGVCRHLPDLGQHLPRDPRGRGDAAAVPDGRHEVRDSREPLFTFLWRAAPRGRPRGSGGTRPSSGFFLLLGGNAVVSWAEQDAVGHHLPDSRGVAAHRGHFRLAAAGRQAPHGGLLRRGSSESRESCAARGPGAIPGRLPAPCSGLSPCSWPSISWWIGSFYSKHSRSRTP
jgi:hypothetical protein